MKVRLTLLVNIETVKRIKQYAKKNKTTVSKIAEDHFDMLTRKPTIKGKTFTEKYAGTLKYHIPDIELGKKERVKAI